MHVGRQIIGHISVKAVVEIVTAGNQLDPLIILETFQHLITVTEEIEMRQDVVFDDNALFFVLKKPRKGRAHPLATAKVLILIEAMDLTRPVNVFDDSTRLSTLLCFTDSICTGAVRSNIKPWRSGFADTSKNAPRCLGAFKDEKQYGGCHYFRIVYIREAREIKILVPDNHKFVTEPTLEFCDFTLLGST